MTNNLLVPPPASLLAPMQVPAKLLSGPGPSNMPEAIANAMTAPLLGHLHPEFVKIMDEVKEGLKYLFQTENDWTFAISGTGHTALEAACMNMVQAGEKVLVCRNGIWGDRFAEAARRQLAEPVFVEAPAGSAFSLDELEAALSRERPAVMFITHGESSTGVLQPLEQLGKLCHSYNTLLLVDSVAACGGVPLLTDSWGIDCVYTGSQKCLNCPPGISPITFSPAAVAKILSRQRPPCSWALDAKELANYWGCRTVESEGVVGVARRYHHTAPISLIYALRAALSLYSSEGAAAVWQRHAAAQAQLIEGLSSLGLRCFVQLDEVRLPTITTVTVPQHLVAKELCTVAMQGHAVEIAGGLGPTANKVWRIGLMGVNADAKVVEQVLAAMRDALARVAAASSGVGGNANL